MIINRIRKFCILTGFVFITSAATNLCGQIITLAELTKDFDISDMVSLKISGSYKIESGDTLDKAVKAIVVNSLNSPINKVHLSVLLSKSLPSLKNHIKTMGDIAPSGNREAWTYTESVSPDSSASDEQYVTFTQPVRKYKKARREERNQRKDGTFVETLYDGPLPLPASSSINILKGKGITLDGRTKTGIYRLAIVLSHPDKSGISLTPKITKMHYLIIRHDATPAQSR